MEIREAVRLKQEAENKITIILRELEKATQTSVKGLVYFPIGVVIKLEL